MHRHALTVLALASVVAPGCTARDATRRPAVQSVRIVCAATLQAACFDAPSRLCGADGYDLFFPDGRRATVGDARHGPLEARCRR